MPSLNHCRIAACAVAALFLCACQNVPKYKKSNGRFDEWESYEGKRFKPSSGVVTAVDAGANTITILKGKDTVVFTVTAATRIVHEGTDIPLAEVPLNQPVKYTLSEDGTQLLSVWYGHHLYTFPRAGSGQKRTNSL